MKNRAVLAIGEKANCGGCVFWQKVLDRSTEGYQDEGICRRNAPTAIPIKGVDYQGDDVSGNYGMLAAWPRTFEESDWCGEFHAMNNISGRSPLGTQAGGGAAGEDG